MDTARVDIAYRPLRVAWAIKSDDRASFDFAVRASNALWGGRFNPIVLIDRPEAANIIETFRVDLIVPVGSSNDVQQFADKFPHIRSPLFPDNVFVHGKQEPGFAQILDIHNALVHWHDKPDWKYLCDQGLQMFTWDDADPLAGVFQIQYGAYPSKEQIGIDYGTLVSDAMSPTPLVSTKIERDKPIPKLVLEKPAVAYLSRAGLERHYSIRPGRDRPGVFVGDASSVIDLATFWNIRAADGTAYFFDPAHTNRFETIKPEFVRQLTEELTRKGDELSGRMTIWAPRARLDDAIKLFPAEKTIGYGVDDYTWNGLNVRPPMMVFGREASLGVIGNDDTQPKISFALKDKPFCGDTWFHTQHLVASISIIGGSSRNPQHTFCPPYVPELNDAFGWEMHFDRNKIRVEPGSVGIVIDAAEHDCSLKGLPRSLLAQKLFELAGIKAEPSNAGLIAQQLMTRMGGIDGTRAFKIPGVRRLIKQYGLKECFTKKQALELIRSTDLQTPFAQFQHYEDLFIEPRPTDTKLTPQIAFAHLVEKGLFRIGAELKCPTCNLPSWIALDQLKQINVCELCGSNFDGTRQLVDSQFTFRRSGILGVEDNNSGAVPVALLLQQLSSNIHRLGSGASLLPSFNLKQNDTPPCETDFVVVVSGNYPDPTQIIIGECKDQGGAINANDVENMRRIAKAFPGRRFETFVLFCKLAPFTADEVALAKGLNDEHVRRVILLTNRELETHRIYERAEKELGIKSHGSNPRAMADTTAEIYFKANATPKK